MRTRSAHARFLTLSFVGFWLAIMDCSFALAQAVSLADTLPEPLIPSGLQADTSGHAQYEAIPTSCTPTDTLVISEVTIASSGAGLTPDDVFSALKILPGGQVGLSDLQDLPLRLVRDRAIGDIDVSFRCVFANVYAIRIRIPDRKQGRFTGSAFLDDNFRGGLFASWTQNSTDRFFTKFSASAIIFPRENNFHFSLQLPVKSFAREGFSYRASATRSTNKYYELESIQSGFIYQKDLGRDYFDVSLDVSRRNIKVGSFDSWPRSQFLQFGLGAGMSVCAADGCPQTEWGIYHRVPLSRSSAKSTTFQMRANGSQRVSSAVRLTYDLGGRAVVLSNRNDQRPLADRFLMGGNGSVSGFDRGEIGYTQPCASQCGGRLAALAKISADVFLKNEDETSRPYISAFWEGGLISETNFAARKNYQSFGLGVSGEVRRIKFELSAARAINSGSRGVKIYFTFLKSFCFSDEVIFTLRRCRNDDDASLGL